MTHLARALKRFMPYRSAARIAHRVGISPAHLSRVRNGQRGISSAVLKSLSEAVCVSPIDRAELIIAHLKDESCGYWPGLIEIKIKRGKTTSSSTTVRQNRA